MKWIAIIFCFLMISPVHAAKVQFPDEELAKESVLPVFEPPVAMKNRRVPTESRFEVAGLGGATLNDAFNSPISFGGEATYHFNSFHAAQLMGMSFLNAQSSYANQLKTQYQMDFSKAPYPNYLVLANYEYAPFYGKISLTKSWMVNLNIFATAGVGMMGFSSSDSSIVGSLGLGQRFYFTPNFGLKVDLKGLMYNGVNPLTSVGTLKPVNTTPNFQKEFTFNMLMTVGMLYMFPTL